LWLFNFYLSSCVNRYVVIQVYRTANCADKKIPFLWLAAMDVGWLSVSSFVAQQSCNLSEYISPEKRPTNDFKASSYFLA
jgi:hypothetical protein